MVHTCRLQNIDISTKPKSTLVAISLSYHRASHLQATITSATTESTQMFKLICYQLVVLHITLYFGLVVSSNGLAAQAHAMQLTRTDTKHTNDSRSTRMSAAIHMERKYCTRETNTFVRKIARTVRNLSGSPSYACRIPLACTEARGRCCCSQWDNVTGHLDDSGGD